MHSIWFDFIFLFYYISWLTFRFQSLETVFKSSYFPRHDYDASLHITRFIAFSFFLACFAFCQCRRKHNIDVFKYQLEQSLFLNFSLIIQRDSKSKQTSGFALLLLTINQCELRITFSLNKRGWDIASWEIRMQPFHPPVSG